MMWADEGCAPIDLDRTGIVGANAAGELPGAGEFEGEVAVVWDTDGSMGVEPPRAMDSLVRSSSPWARAKLGFVLIMTALFKCLYSLINSKR